MQGEIKARATTSAFSQRLLLPYPKFAHFPLLCRIHKPHTLLQINYFCKPALIPTHWSIFWLHSHFPDYTSLYIPSSQLYTPFLSIFTWRRTLVIRLKTFEYDQWFSFGTENSDWTHLKANGWEFTEQQGFHQFGSQPTIHTTPWPSVQTQG